ncbi:hypothetical protein GCM10010172_25420 [Paractinoplanes ferrugineus]|uniref:Polyketide cyclase n=1 Tax=Paractinoplanes ferrugineus TaxID=113564 RepID=A0A919IWF0_9ACTN|nr:hypothetical protein [Actinoplanes ferrugineus]GIE08548.1 hypothetical protein Afe05nite_03880 [Actinoplanes ferrugineus]
MTELLELTAVVEAPPERVAEVLLDVRPGGRSPLGVAGDGDDFVVVDRGSRITVRVDRAARSIAQQGEWWYRGVTSVEPDPRGSRVVHRIFNVADGRGWAVRWVSRGPLNAAPGSFAAIVRDLGEQLGVRAVVLD